MKRAKTLATKNYIALARVSSKAQQDEGFSLDTQVDALHAYATKQGGQVVRLWRIAETATKAEQRTEFRAMLAYAKKHAEKVDGLLVCKIDRAARNLSDYGRLLELESAYGVPLIAVTQPTQDTPAGRMARGSLALMAAFFTDQLSVDVKQGLARWVSEGWFPTVPPFGYRTERVNSRSIVRREPVEAANVERIFQLYAHEYKTLDGVIQKLKEEGRVYSAKQPHWVRSKIHRILRDRSYIGDVKFHGGWVPGKHPPLVNRLTFDRVQELLGDKVYRPQELTYAGELIACAHCGRRITGEIITKKTTGKAYKYYRCAGYLAPGHPRIRLREAEIEAQVVAHLAKIEQPESVRNWFRSALKARATHDSDQSRARAHEIENQLDDVRRQQDRLLNVHLSGTVDEQAFNAKNTELRDRVAHLTLQLEAVDRRKDENADLSVRLFELSQGLRTKWVKSDYAEKRRILDLVCLNLILDGITLVISTRKPFNCLVEGLDPSESGEGESR